MRNTCETTTLLPNTQKSGLQFQDFKIEPALACVLFGWYLSLITIPNQMLRHTCLNRGYNATDCDNLVDNNGNKEIEEKSRGIEEKVQPEVATILMVASLISSIVPSFLNLLLGPWSDKFGRKKVICATYFGYSAALTLLTLISIVSNNNIMISPWIYVLIYIPVAFTGGWPALALSTICYVSDTSHESSRSVRFTIIEIVIFGGILLGTASSSFVLKATNPTSVFMISTLCVIAATIYTIMFVEESRQNLVQRNFGDQLAELFSPAPLIEMLKTCFKRRQHNGRKILWCLIVILAFNAIS